MNYLEVVGFVHVMFYASYGAFKIWSAAFKWINPPKTEK